MPGIIYFVPGFSATELYRDPAHAHLYWVDPSAIAVFTPGAMTLAPDGVSPGGLFGIQLYAGNPLSAYWFLVEMILNQQLGPLGYTQSPWGWDWRMDLYAAGVSLAADIRDNVDPSVPCTIVGHSAGGLVARAAWRELVRSGDSALVRRIITLGTPHWGTYYAVATWSGMGDLDTQLVGIEQAVLGGSGSWLGATVVPWVLTQIVNVALTWPALYQLLPLVGAPDQSGDPNRPQLYTASKWHGLAGQIDVAHLAAVLSARDPWMNDPASHPPSWVITAVGGHGYATPSTFINPAQLGLPAGIGSTLAGDGVVTTSSAEADYLVTARLTARHSDLPFYAALTGQLAAWIKDPRGPLSPVPPATVDPAVYPIYFGGPPLTSISLDPGAQAVCLGGICNC